MISICAMGWLRAARMICIPESQPGFFSIIKRGAKTGQEKAALGPLQDFCFGLLLSL
jgi:hypothetical protein